MGAMCTKYSYGRGVGSPLICPNDKEQSGLLCYDKCEIGTGVGPVCWGTCPAGTNWCGLLCLHPDEEQPCLEKIKNVTKEAISAVGSTINKDYPKAVMATAGITVDLAYPMCYNMN